MIVVLCLANSPQSHLHVGGVFCSLTPTSDICFLAQVVEVTIKYNTLPLIIHLLSPHPSLRMLVDLAILIGQATRIRRIVRALIKGNPRGAVNTSLQVYTPNEERFLGYLNLDHLAELITQQARKLGDREDHLTGMIECTSAVGPARSWFKKLSPRIIDSFSDLSRLFVSNFMSCKVRQKNASHLFTVHMKDGENLKDYVRQFNQAVLEVEDPARGEAVHSTRPQRSRSSYIVPNKGKRQEFPLSLPNGAYILHQVILGMVTLGKVEHPFIVRNVSHVAHRFLLGIVPSTGHHFSHIESKAPKKRLQAKDVPNRVELSLL
ncbi:hypothetical protein Acr_07g0016030 [Actinidia rufa]|uniref:Retrotransposon gag domain-containing protein n=1 Tax=Actinidia rufa TaxID=165716 RepID=A0A7J0F0K6_9ERIC|nr:hypothetical protein Acr_07g0016030 [Actinidia rufa]